MCQLETLSLYRYKFWKQQTPMISETFYFRKTCLFLLHFLFAQSPAVLNRHFGSLAYFSLSVAFGFLQDSSQVLLQFSSQSYLHACSSDQPRLEQSNVRVVAVLWKQTPVQVVAGVPPHPLPCPQQAGKGY